MLVRRLVGNLFMEMFSGHLAVWFFSQLLLEQVLS
jgi:hypothetical protein